VVAAESSKYSNIYKAKDRGGFGEGYSLFVKVLKLILPLSALVILGVVIVHLSVDTKTPQISKQVPNIKKVEKTIPGQVEVLKAKYEGVDEKGKNYTITADKASRITKGGDGVIFKNPVADIVLGDSSWLAIKSLTGSFNRENEILVLKNKVKVFHDSGYEISLKDISINLRNKTASTKSPVTIKGPMGIIDAQSFDVTNNGNLLSFNGPVYLKIFNFSSGVK